MYKNIAFMYEGNKFVTLFNGSEYLRTAAVKPGGNYADFVKVLTDRGIHNAYKNATGCGPRDLPTVEPTSISEDGTNISFKGTYADSSNNMHQVEVTATDIIIDNESAYGTAAEEKKTEEPAVEEKPTEAEEVKEEKLEEPAAEEKTEESTEEKPEEEIEEPAEVKEEEPTEEEKTTEPVAEEEKPEEHAVEEEKTAEPEPSPSMSAGYQEEPVAPEVTEERNIKTLSEITKETGAACKKARTKAYITVGAEVKKTPPMKRPVVIGKKVSTSGCYFGGGAAIHTKDVSAPTSVPAKKPQITEVEKEEASTKVELPKMKRTTPVRVEMKEEEEPKFEPKRPVVEPSVPSTPKYSKSYSYSRHEDKHADAEPFYKVNRETHEMKNDLFNAYEATQIVDDADKEAMKNNTAIKETVLKELAPEVANVIDQIPAILFNDITEFMGHEVDQEALASLGNVYCIDERWHAGPYGWYCVDVVSSSSRYFYNAQQNISVSIPIGQVKAWKRAITI